MDLSGRVTELIEIHAIRGRFVERIDTRADLLVIRILRCLRFQRRDAALRLTRFNVQPARYTGRFEGLPSPPAAGMVLSSVWFGGFLRAHNLAINEDSGFAYAVGTNMGACSQGLYFIDIRNPANPAAAGCFGPIWCGACRRSSTCCACRT